MGASLLTHPLDTVKVQLQTQTSHIKKGLIGTKNNNIYRKPLHKVHGRKFLVKYHQKSPFGKIWFGL